MIMAREKGNGQYYPLSSIEYLRHAKDEAANAPHPRTQV
jgi:hypothetical protein